MIPFSILDLSPINEGSDAAQSFRNTLDLARHAERWGYHRFWLAEHHGMPGIASAATAVLIGHVAGGTSTIRVGAGGIMLPNHSPLVIAEQFGTLESLYPGRIDLGLGRAPGSDQLTARALRRNLAADPNQFPAGRRRTDGLLLGDETPCGPRRAGRRAACADMDPRLQPVRRASGGGTGPALRVRIAFCAGADDAGDRAVSLHLQAVRAAGKAVRDARLQRVCGGQRRGGALSRDLDAAGIRQPAQRLSQAICSRRCGDIWTPSRRISATCSTTCCPARRSARPTP